MTKDSLGQYILIDPADAPSLKELETAVATLKHCADVYTKMRGRNDPFPEPLLTVASFLESMVHKDRKKLKKKEKLDV